MSAQQEQEIEDEYLLVREKGVIQQEKAIEAELLRGHAEQFADEQQNHEFRLEKHSLLLPWAPCRRSRRRVGLEPSVGQERDPWPD